MDPDEDLFAEDQNVEISDLPGDEQAGPVECRPRPERVRRRRLFQLGGLLTIGALCLALLLRSIPDLGPFLFTSIFSPTPTPITSTGPDISLFYVNVAPPWGTLSIDGKRVVHPPDSESGQPLRLAPGRHLFTWRAAPFPTQSCTLSVPASLTDTCAARETSSAPHQELAWTISFWDSLATLSKEQQHMLTTQIQQALDRLQASDIVRPGEQFVDVTSSGDGSTPSSPIGIARQPLRATLNLTLDNSSFCADRNANSSCSLNWQDCYTLCTSGGQGMSWDVQAIVRTSWTYTTLDGHVVTTNMADALGGAALIEHLISLTITWDGTQWYAQAAPEFTNGPIPCVSAEDNDTISTLFGTSPWQAFDWQYIPAANIAAGCLLVLTSIENRGPSPTISSQIIYLHRFGVFIAINRLAQEYDPEMPRPNAYEMSLVQEIMARAHLST